MEKVTKDMTDQQEKNVGMQHTLNSLVCLICKNGIEKSNGLTIRCVKCGKKYEVRDGIPIMFVGKDTAEGPNKIFQRMYDIVAYVYNANTNMPKKIFSPLDKFHIDRFFPQGEDKARTDIIRRLGLKDGVTVLETGVGRGENIQYIADENKKLQFYGMDVSFGMLRLCDKTARRFNVSVNLLLANAEDLPYRDDYFDIVFHVGGINFFTNKRKAIKEMVRVAKPNTKILISDETSKIFTSRNSVKKLIDRILLGDDLTKRFAEFKETEILDCLPEGIKDIKFDIIWEGNGYCLEFKKK